MSPAPAAGVRGGRGAVPRWLPDALLAGALALLVLGPLLPGRGLVLAGDMVFVPDQPWKDAWTGGDGGVPRAVPSDAWVSALTTVVPGDVLQRVVLVAILVGAATGVSRLTWSLPFMARAAAAVLFVWNPYVHERLAIGHWALLCGYAALPWAAEAVVRLREQSDVAARRRAWAVLVTALAVAGWSSPTGGVMVAATAACLAVGHLALVGRTLAVSLAVNLPWMVPAFGNGADQLAPDVFGVEAFSARADTPFGVVGSVLTFGGIWKESIVPAERGDLLLAGIGGLVVALAVWGLWVGRRERVLPTGPAALLSCGALALALAGALTGLRPAVDWIVLEVPGGGLLRDGQKWVAPWALVASVGLGLAVARLAALSRSHGPGGSAWLVAVVLAPVAALPSLALGLGGFLQADRFPDDWDEVRHEMESHDLADEQVVVLPFSTYRRFDWTPRTVLDPAPRYFPGRMVTEDALSVPEGTVGGESALARRVREAASAEELTEVLAETGVRWALVHRSTEPGWEPIGAEVVAETDQLRLLELAPPTGPATYDGGWRPHVYLLLDLGVLLGTTCAVTVLRLGSRQKSPLRGQGFPPQTY